VLTADVERLATYETLPAAELAANQLVEEGHDPGDIVVIARDLRRVRRHPRIERLGLGVRAGVATGTLLAAAGVSLALIVDARTVFALVWVPTCLVFGALAGALVAFAEHRRAERADRDPPSERIIAGQFDVGCHRDPASARRTLARWWHSSARPVAHRQT
jgi:hypothetical protein